MPRNYSSQPSGGASDPHMETVEQEVEDMQKASRPKTFGILAVIFVAVLVIMIGGLASYYYYTFQSQGSTNKQDIRSSWDEVVLTTMDLTNAFDKVNSFDDLVAENQDSFEETLGTANRTLRDVLYDLQGTNNYIFSGSTFVSRLSSFLDDYIAYLRELQRLVEKGRGGVIEDVSVTDDLDNLSTQMNESYDNLLIADKEKIIEANLPRELFEIADEVEVLIKVHLDDKQAEGEAVEAEKTAAGGVATKFMQALMDRDSGAMVIYLTSEAEAGFNPGIVLEDSSEITSFKILDTRKMGESKIEIDAQISKETPDGNAVTENRLFIMLKTDEKWLIDSWAAV